VQEDLVESNQSVPFVNGQRIKHLRTSQHLRTDQVATASGLSVAQIYRLEKNECPNVAAITLARVASVLDTSLEYPLGITDDHRSIDELTDHGNALPVTQAPEEHESR
jgi:transcriptional regulator with XRE-family HTH domain